MIRFELNQRAKEWIDNARLRFESAVPKPEALDRRDAYLRRILVRESFFLSNVKTFFAQMRVALKPVISRAVGDLGVRVQICGAISKACAISRSSNCDLLLQFSPGTEDLPSLYRKLVRELKRAGFAPVEKGCVISCTVLGHQVDLIPAIRVPDKYDSMRMEFANGIGTNPWRQIAYVDSADQSDVIRLVKLWRDQQGLNFPSYYLEVAVVRALDHYDAASLYRRLRKVLRFLDKSFVLVKVLDPGDWRNDLAQTLSFHEQAAIRNAARAALQASTLQEIIRLRPRHARKL